MTSLTEMPADIVEAAKAALVEAVKDVRTGTAIKMSMFGPDKQAFEQAIARAILAERQRDQWQDIATAPKDGTQILVSIHGWNDPSEKFFLAVVEWEDGRWMEGPDAVYPPTHWMTLPAPPKGGA